MTSRDIAITVDDAVATLTLDRPHKRNAIRDETIEALGRFFAAPPAGVRAVVLRAAGDNFSAGLDLSEHRERDAAEVMHHSQMWHRVLNAVQFSGLPVVAVLKGAVIGGGLEIASACHVRVAEQGAYYALPEAVRGIYVGGGASVRVARLIGQGRMIEMMLTGRVHDTQTGQQLGISHYLVGPGEGEALGLSLARQIAANAPLSNYAILNAIPRISDMGANDGFFVESLMAAVVQTGDDARQRLGDFLEKRAVTIKPKEASQDVHAEP
ncbi:MAG: crotonase/enoyl-CoA hydratase family protein [Pseudomonadota bacterium]